MPKLLSPELRTLLEGNLAEHKQEVFSLPIWESANLRNKQEDEELMEKERRRHAQSAAVKEITSGLEKDLRAAAASGAAIASLQAEVERASQRAEMYVLYEREAQEYTVHS